MSFTTIPLWVMVTKSLDGGFVDFAGFLAVRAADVFVFLGRGLPFLSPRGKRMPPSLMVRTLPAAELHSYMRSARPPSSVSCALPSVSSSLATVFAVLQV